MSHPPCPAEPPWVLKGALSFTAGTEVETGTWPLLHVESISRGQVLLKVKLPLGSLGRVRTSATQLSV